MKAVSEGRLSEVMVEFTDKTAVCLVLASSGYPGSYEKGKAILNLDSVDEDIVIFHAGTKICGDQLVTNGGRVLNICTLASDLEEGRSKVYKASEMVEFEGKYCRKDIGLN